MKNLMGLLACSLIAVSSFAATPEDVAEEKKLSAAYLQKMSEEAGAQVIDKGIVIRPIFESGSEKFP